MIAAVRAYAGPVAIVDSGEMSAFVTTLAVACGGTHRAVGRNGRGRCYASSTTSRAGVQRSRLGMVSTEDYLGSLEGGKRSGGEPVTLERSPAVAAPVQPAQPAAAAEPEFEQQGFFGLVASRLGDSLDDTRRKLFSTSSSSSSSSSPDGRVTRPRIVVLGSGWAAHALMKTIDTSKFDLVVVSPRNYFVFTPMLASSAVGTVEFRSVCEPIRHEGDSMNYYEA